MGLPKKIKKDLSLIPKKTLLPRRHEIADMISEDGTYLPKSLLHADLDRGFLDFVKDGLKTVVEGKTVPMVDVLITTQNWAQFVETWNFENIDKNVEPPFITVIRTPEVKYGNNPAVMYNIPNRRLYYYAKVPTFDGQRHGMDIYKIPQPVPVDIKYTVAIVCNRMRELNKLNQIIIEKFSSRQAYQVIKGHYIPIVMNEVTDESTLDLEKRKVYIQKYTFTLLGFLIDEDEFEVSPAITRVFQIYETETKTKKRRQNKGEPTPPSVKRYDFATGITATQVIETFDYNVNLRFVDSDNVSNGTPPSGYDVYINSLYYGNDVREIQINSGDELKIDIYKQFPNDTSYLIFNQELL
jgi:hypothetical protein